MAAAQHSRVSASLDRPRSGGIFPKPVVGTALFDSRQVLTQWTERYIKDPPAALAHTLAVPPHLTVPPPSAERQRRVSPPSVLQGPGL